MNGQIKTISGLPLGQKTEHFLQIFVFQGFNQLKFEEKTFVPPKLNITHFTQNKKNFTYEPTRNDSNFSQFDNIVQEIKLGREFQLNSEPQKDRLCFPQLRG